ncbi:MAG: glycosyltransferase family 4 protein [Ruminococcus sp.]|nr:glycosyltransferase family 4 protein [Ruminococcus sp.]
MNNRIRILHVAQSAGGVDRYIRMLIKNLDHDRYENIVIASEDFNERDYRNLADGFTYLKMERKINAANFRQVSALRKLIKKYNPDIIYAHSSIAGALTRMASIGLKKVCIYNPHGWAFNMKCSKKKQEAYILIERLLSAFCDRIICISEAERKSALNNKICGNDKLIVIYNGIDIEGRDLSRSTPTSRKELSIPEDAYVIGMVGRVSEQKAPDVFIKAAKYIKEEITNAFFVIVGSGELEDNVRQYAVMNGFSDSLEITGWVEDPQKYIRQFDVAMLLSRWEGFGLVIPEYMLEGKPVVATSVDAIPYIIENNSNGLLVDADDYKEAAKAVIRLSRDKELYNRIVENAAKDVRIRFDVRRVAREHESLFQEILRS